MRKTHCKNGHPRTPENLNKSGACKICCVGTSRARYVANREKLKAQARAYRSNRKDWLKCLRQKPSYKAKEAAGHRRRKYGMTDEAYKQAIEVQHNCCAICKVTFTDTIYPCVDHAHDTEGRVRGLLCQHCNSGLGQFADSVESLEAAIKYLTK